MLKLRLLYSSVAEAVTADTRARKSRFFRFWGSLGFFKNPTSGKVEKFVGFRALKVF